MGKGGFRLRRSVKIAPGVRLNIGKKSMGISAGVKGMRVSTNTRTGSRMSVGVPGTGLRYEQSLNGSKKHSSSRASVSNSTSRNEFEPEYVTDPGESFTSTLSGLARYDGHRITDSFRALLEPAGVKLKGKLTGASVALGAGILALIIAMAGNSGAWLWTVALLGYGLYATNENARRAKENKAAVIGYYEDFKNHFDAVMELDTKRAKLVKEMYMNTGSIEPLVHAETVPMILDADETPYYAAQGYEARAVSGGLVVGAQGTFIVTDKNVHFLTDGEHHSVAIKRVMQAAVEESIVLALTIKNGKKLFYGLEGDALTAGAVILSLAKA